MLSCLMISAKVSAQESSHIQNVISKALSPNPGSCIAYSKPATKPMFRNVKGINLYVSLPQRLKSALECHDQEDKCAAKFSNADAYIRILKQDYETLPKSLYPENIAKIFKEKLEKDVAPFVNWTEKCDTTEVKVLDYKERLKETRVPGFINVVIRVSTDEVQHHGAKLQAISLTTFLYRPDAVDTDFDTQVMSPQTMSIALDRQNAEIDNQVRYLADHSRLHVMHQGDMVP